MAAKPTDQTAQPKPSIGRVVTYRSRAGVDMPAMITATIPGQERDQAVHLHLFPPPGAGKDQLDHQWGVASETSRVTSLFDEDGHARLRWRWPERVG